MKCSTPGLDPERPKGAHRPEAEQPVLAEARERVPLVEPGRDPPVERVVLLELGVEEVERHAPDLRAPDVERDLAAEEGERERERAAAVVAHLNGREPLGHDLRPVLVLQPRPVDALLEVPLAVEQPDPDHRQREVARCLEDVARERAEPARVDRQRRVHAELGADEDRPGRRGPSIGVSGRARSSSSTLCEAGDPLERRAVRGGHLRQVRRQVGELAHRVAGMELPGVRVERAEELRPVRVPRPAVVERDPRERRELRRQPPCELGGALVRLLRSRQRRDVHDPRRAHGAPT